MRKLILVFMFFPVAGFAQQDSQFTQYMYNTISINPGYAGSRGVMSIFGLYRTQWVGLDGAPESSSFSLNTPLNDSTLGLGVSLLNDKSGPTNENSFSVDLSYSIRTSESFKLSFGIKAVANMFNLDISKLKFENQSDPGFQELDNKFSPNVGAGIYLHSENAYIGFSVPGFVESNRYDDNSTAILREKINYYLIGGYVFDLNPNLKFKPAFLTKMIAGAPLQIDLSANFLLINKLTAGLSYRWNGAIGAMVGFQISDGLYLGYGYDHETTKLNKYNSGSHEIFLRFEFFNNYDRITSPRFF